MYDNVNLYFKKFIKEDLWEYLIGVNLLNYKLKIKLLFVIFDIYVKCNFLIDIEKKMKFINLYFM